MEENIHDVFERALTQAKVAFDETPENPVGCGYAHIDGVDGRTKAVKEAKDHIGIDVRTSDYYGTMINLGFDSQTQTLAKKRAALRAFLDVCSEHGHFEDARVNGRLD